MQHEPKTGTDIDLRAWMRIWGDQGETVVAVARHLYVVRHSLGNLELGYSVRSALEKRATEDVGADVSGGMFDTQDQALEFINALLEADLHWAEKIQNEGLKK